MLDDATLHLTAVLEKAAFVFFPALLVLPWLATRRRTEPEPSKARAIRSEIGLLLLILAGALVLRLLWWDQGIPGTIFGGEIITAHADLALQHGGLWARWWQLVRSTNGGGWHYDSPIVEPVVVAFELIFPPQIQGIVRVGAFFGVIGVALAWLTGRLLHGPRFGLLFAGLVAVSPLQVVWSRLGYRAMAAMPHVLLAMALAALAARRGSVLLAVLAGVVSYASLYSYEIARAAIPLAVLAFWAGTRAPVRRNGRFVVLSIVFVVVVLALAATLPPTGIKDTLWPTYAGYAGNQGEKTLSDFVEKNYVRVKTESRRVLNDYFVSSRNSPPRPAVWSWGIASGGLTFLTVSADNAHTCGVTLDSSAYCWGDNQAGELGIGSRDLQFPSQHPDPLAVSGGLSFRAVNTSVSPVAAHTCGITTGNVVYCWGDYVTLPARVPGQQ